MNGEHDRYARGAARILATRLPSDPPSPSRLGRDALLCQMVKAIEERGRLRKRYLGLGLLALAASALLIFKIMGGQGSLTDPSLLAPIVEDIHGGDNLLIRKGASQSLRGPMGLQAGDQLVASRLGGTTLSFADGTRADLARESNVTVAELGEQRRLALGQGRLDVHVAKLGADRRFLVSTPDSVVEVHGTVFSVYVAKSGYACPGETSQTRVRVSEGVVSVDHAGRRIFLHPGDTWPCVEPAASAPPEPVAPDPEPVVDAPTPRPVPAVRSREEDFKRKPLPRKVADSNLAEQNDLFGEALAAEKRGEIKAALRTLDRLLRKFPGGPLDESARAERRKLLRR
jgi:hypothetical protein